MVKFDKSHIIDVLKNVMDPEIPVLSLVDLGVIGDINFSDNLITIDLKPTFSGCPAIDQMKIDIKTKLYSVGFQNVLVNVNFRDTWTTNDITDGGKIALKKFGIAPPGNQILIDEIEILEYAECPQCGSNDTKLMNAFGPTLCRSVHYCNYCLEAFQSFKPLL